jgi:hypothetical protein
MLQQTEKWGKIFIKLRTFLRLTEKIKKGRRKGRSIDDWQLKGIFGFERFLVLK